MKIIEFCERIASFFELQLSIARPNTEHRTPNQIQCNEKLLVLPLTLSMLLLLLSLLLLFLLLLLLVVVMVMLSLQLHISFALKPQCQSIRSLFFISDRTMNELLKSAAFAHPILMHFTLQNQSFHSYSIYSIYHMFPIIEKCCTDSRSFVRSLSDSLLHFLNFPVFLSIQFNSNRFNSFGCCYISTNSLYPPVAFVNSYSYFNLLFSQYLFCEICYYVYYLMHASCAFGNAVAHKHTNTHILTNLLIK